MKKMLLMSLFVVIGMMAMNAQTNLPDDAKLVKVEVGPEFEVAGDFSPAVQGKRVKSSEAVKPSKVSKATTADFPEGTFTARGVAYWDGDAEFEITIRKDAAQGNMYWFGDMFPRMGTSAQEFYGTLSGTTFTIPLGQTVYKYETEEGLLYGIDSSQAPFFTGNITATVYADEHKIVFNHGYGAQGKDGGWYEIMLVGVALYAEGWVPPVAAVIPPRGMLWGGLTDDYYALSNNYGYLPANTEWTFRNATKGENLTYFWEWNRIDFPDETNPGTVYDFDSTNKDVSFRADLNKDVFFERYTVPYLTATNEKELESSYLLGNNTKDLTQFWAYIETQGTAPAGTTPSGTMIADMTNVNLDKGRTSHRSSAGYNYFGTGGRSQALIGIYETPVEGGEIYFEGAKFIITDFKAPAATKFTLEVYEITGYNIDDSGDVPVAFPEFGNLIGYASALASSFKVAGNITGGGSYGVLYFDEFFEEDEFGFENPKPFFQLGHDFAFVFSGYDVPNVELSVWTGKHTEFDTDSRFYSFFITPEGEMSCWDHIRSPMTISLLNSEYIPAPIVSIPDLAVDSSEVKAVRQGDNFILTYAPAAKFVTVYNVAGQKVAQYPLNSTGSFTMPAADLNGVYILKFDGINQAVKILK